MQGQLFAKLVDSVQFYLGFEIADQSGIALTEGKWGHFQRQILSETTVVHYTHHLCEWVVVLLVTSRNVPRRSSGGTTLCRVV